MSAFRRILTRIRGSKKEEEKKDDKAEPSIKKATPSESESELKPAESKEILEVQPEGTLFASSAELRVNHNETALLAKEAKISDVTTSEIVPGKLLKRDNRGRVHIKIVFYGPSLSGKTTALRWLFANVRSLSKGKIVEIADELGRTTFFDFVPVTASERIVFDVFTVAGQRRHARARISVLRDADGIIFMADSRPEAMNENLASIEELRIALGTDRVSTLPIVVAFNKRDLPNALPIEYMSQMLDFEEYPIFATIATEGKNLLRMFQRILRDALVFKVGI